MEPAPSQSIPKNGPVLVFDGDCALCNASVRFVLDHEREPRVLRFASMQGEGGRALLRAHGFDPEKLSTLVLIEDGRAFTRTHGALRLAGYLRAPWRSARLARVLPALVLDPVYRLIAKNRYRLFGKADRCVVDDRLGRRVIKDVRE